MLSFFRGNRGFNLSLILAAVLLLSGCSGGTAGAPVGLNETGSYKLNVAWPGLYGKAPVECADAPNIDSRMIPEDTQTISVEITGEGLTTPETFSISYPQTELLIEDLPQGNKTALIQALDASAAIKAQRKESFKITMGETTDSGNIPLGIAIKGNSDSPVFEPSTFEAIPGRPMYFQNWTEDEITCRASIRETVEDMVLPGVSVDSRGLTVFSGKARNIYGYCPVNVPGTSASMTIITPVIQPVETGLIDYIPRYTNDGINGIKLQGRNGGSYYDLVLNTDSEFWFVNAFNSAWYEHYPRVKIHNQSAGQVEAHPYYWSGVHRDSIIRVALNGDYGQVRVKGTAKSYDTGTVKYYIYKGASNYGIPLWQSIGNGSFDLTVSYNEGDELFFAANSLGEIYGDGSLWENVTFQAVE